jgi:mRNA deadenylase 3'-5' endonuclease subunit Ccr4
LARNIEHNCFESNTSCNDVNTEPFLFSQEVETSQFYSFFLPELKRDGYDGIFSPKSRAKTMAENERKFVDGCAIFYRTAK